MDELEKIIDQWLKDDFYGRHTNVEGLFIKEKAELHRRLVPLIKKQTSTTIIKTKIDMLNWLIKLIESNPKIENKELIDGFRKLVELEAKDLKEVENGKKS